MRGSGVRVPPPAPVKRPKRSDKVRETELNPPDQAGFLFIGLMGRSALLQVAGFAQLLRGCTYTASLSFEDVIRESAKCARRGPPWLPRRFRGTRAQGTARTGNVRMRRVAGHS